MGKIGRAIIASIWSTISYIVVPIVIFSLLESKLPEEISIGDLKTTQMYILIFGIAIVICTFFKSYFDSGTYLRLIFGLVMIGFICLWIFAIMGGGIYDMAVEETTFHIDFSRLVLLIVFATVLKGIYMIAEFFVMKKKNKETEELPTFEIAPKNYQPFQTRYTPPSNQPYPQKSVSPSNIPPGVPPPPPPDDYLAPNSSKVEKRYLEEDEWLD